ncbi:DUF4249 domain-containing protein [Neolewinella litorea]|nr:DUF4249 domain-containing protein [Neolewinella litorea]
MRYVPLTTLLRQSGVLFLSFFVFVACEEAVDLEFDVPKSKLVLSSSFYPAEPVILRVSATRPRGNAPAQEISDAQVSLFEGNKLAEVLTYYPGTETAAGGSYRTVHFRPEVGHEYTIHVSAPGYDPVTAISSIPEPVAINSLAVKNLTVMEEEGEFVYDYYLQIDYADPATETNYYDLRISQLVVPFKITARGDTLRLDPVPKAVSTPTQAAMEGNTVSLLLQDKQAESILEVHLQSRLNPENELLDRIVAELRTVSPEYYFYQRSLALPNDLGGTGLDEPVIYFNNVESGLGVFAGYNSVQRDYFPSYHD